MFLIIFVVNSCQIVLVCCFRKIAPFHIPVLVFVCGRCVLNRRFFATPTDQSFRGMRRMGRMPVVGRPRLRLGAGRRRRKRRRSGGGGAGQTYWPCDGGGGACGGDASVAAAAAVGASA